MSPQETTDANKRSIRRYLDEAWNTGNLDVIDEVMAPGYVRYMATGRLDREAQKQRIAGFRRGLPDLRIDVEQMVAEGDLVAFRIQVHGTHMGPLLGVAPTNKPFTITATDVVRMENGAAVEHWGNMDEAGLLRQLGVLPD